jgi:hypothetical protein
MIDKAVDNILNNTLSVNYNVVFKEIPSYYMISLREIIPNYFSEGMLWKKLYQFIEREGIEVSSKQEHCISIYHNPIALSIIDIVSIDYENGLIETSYIDAFEGAIFWI